MRFLVLRRDTCRSVTTDHVPSQTDTRPSSPTCKPPTICRQHQVGFLRKQCLLALKLPVCLRVSLGRNPGAFLSEQEKDFCSETAQTLSRTVCALKQTSTNVSAEVFLRRNGRLLCTNHHCDVEHCHNAWFARRGRQFRNTSTTVLALAFCAADSLMPLSASCGIVTEVNIV